jgi:uncharacterized protein YsxB (DUF464 family)
MLKRFIYFAIIPAALFLFSFTSYAYSAEEIAGQSDFLYVRDSSIISSPMSEDMFWNEYERAVTDTLNACDAVETGGVQYDADSDGYRFQITANQINTLIAHQEYVDQWTRQTIPLVAKQGMDRETAIHNVYDWIINQYQYNANLNHNFLTSESYQGVYAMITSPDQEGICSSFSKLFRTMVEAIPFNEHQIVDYQTSTPNYIKVSLVNNAGLTHEWDAIVDPDGTCYYYDLSAQDIASGAFSANSSLYSAGSYYKLTPDKMEKYSFYGNPDTFIYNR